MLIIIFIVISILENNIQFLIYIRDFTYTGEAIKKILLHKFVKCGAEWAVVYCSKNYF